MTHQRPHYRTKNGRRFVAGLGNKKVAQPQPLGKRYRYDLQAIRDGIAQVFQETHEQEYGAHSSLIATIHPNHRITFDVTGCLPSSTSVRFGDNQFCIFSKDGWSCTGEDNIQVVDEEGRTKEGYLWMTDSKEWEKHSETADILIGEYVVDVDEQVSDALDDAVREYAGEDAETVWG